MFSCKTPFARYQTLVPFTGGYDGCSVFTSSSFLYFLVDNFADWLKSWDFFIQSSKLTGMESKNLLNYLVMMHNLETEEHICCIFYFGFSQIYNSSWSVKLNLERAVLCTSRLYRQREMFLLLYFIQVLLNMDFFFFVYFGGKQKCCIQKNILNLRKQRHSAWKQPTTDSRQHKQLKGEQKLPESHVCDLNIESIWQLLRKNVPG